MRNQYFMSQNFNNVKKAKRQQPKNELHRIVYGQRGWRFFITFNLIQRRALLKNFLILVCIFDFIFL